MIPISDIQRAYTRVIAIFFLLIGVSLVADWFQFGHRPETWHKIFHILLGAAILKYGWNNPAFWRPFCLINGSFFLFVAAFGVTFPDFGGLDAFNRLDTILHAIVGITGIVIGVPKQTSNAHR